MKNTKIELKSILVRNPQKSMGGLEREIPGIGSNVVQWNVTSAGRAEPVFKPKYMYTPGMGERWVGEPTLAERIRLLNEINGKKDVESFEPSTTNKRLKTLISQCVQNFNEKDLSKAWKLGNQNMEEHWSQVHELILKERSHRRIKGVKGNKSPWTHIPNVEKAKIIMGNHDPSTDRKIGTTMEFTRYRNNKMNKYMKHIVKALEKNRDNPEKYWKLAEVILTRSKIFRLAAINHVYPTWYKTIKLSDLRNLIRNLEGALKTPGVPMDSKRFYVRKSNGGLRPIGAPDPTWRIILHMANNLLQWFYDPHLDPDQHAYQPGKGTGTAWRALIQDGVLAQPYVREYDLKGFFDRVKVDPIMAELHRVGVPKKWTDTFHTWHSKKPYPASWLETDEMEEYDREIEERNQRNWDSKGLPMTESQPKPWLTGRLHSISFAQGSPMAPTLSIIGKNLWVKKMKKKNPDSKFVIYADDGIVGSPRPIELEDDEELGIEIAQQKTHDVKIEGEWKRNLQFLGLLYHWQEGRITINTRSGIIMDPGKEELDMILTLRKNLMPQLMAKGQVKWIPMEKHRLNIKPPTPPLPWKAYHIKRNWKQNDGLGGFGNTTPDTWTWEGTKEGEGYFSWLPEIHPERYSGEMELRQLSETRLWDWYYSRGYNAARKEANKELGWERNSMIEHVMKNKRRLEPMWKNLINASSVANYRLMKLLSQEQKRRYLHKGNQYEIRQKIATKWTRGGSIIGPQTNHELPEEEEDINWGSSSTFSSEDFFKNLDFLSENPSEISDEVGEEGLFVTQQLADLRKMLQDKHK
jgi:hypothetical protein